MPSLLSRIRSLVVRKRPEIDRPILGQIGKAGESRYSSGGKRTARGRVLPRFDSYSFALYDEVRQYPIVADAIETFAKPICRAKFFFTGSSHEAVALAEKFIRPMIPELIEHLVLGGFNFGVQPCEVVWAPKLDFEVKPQTGPSFWVPCAWIPSRILPFDPKHVRLFADQRTGQLTGLELYAGTVGPLRFVPASKLIIWTHRPEFGSFYGTPKTRPVVPFVQRANELWDDFGRYYRRLGMPWTLGRYGGGLMEYPNEEDGENAMPINKADQMLEFVQGLQSGHSLVLPSTTDHHGRYQWDVSIIGDPTTQHNFTSALDFVHEIIRTGLCVPKLASSSEVNAGTYNLGAAQLQQHNENIQYTLESLAAAINKYLLKPFTRWNFGTFIDPVKIEFAPISTDIQIMLLQGLIAQLSSGVDVMDPDGNQLIVDWAKVAEDGGLPILKKDQRRELLDLFRQRQQELEAMQQSEQAPPPTAEPQMEPEQPPTEEVPTA